MIACSLEGDLIDVYIQDSIKCLALILLTTAYSLECDLIAVYIQYSIKYLALQAEIIINMTRSLR